MFLKNQEKRKDKQDKQEERKNGQWVAYNPLTTKRKTFCFGRFTKQNKKYLQIKSPQV
jgi:hypothetical protein